MNQQHSEKKVSAAKANVLQAQEARRRMWNHKKLKSLFYDLNCFARAPNNRTCLADGTSLHRWSRAGRDLYIHYHRSGEIHRVFFIEENQGVLEKRLKNLAYNLREIRLWSRQYLEIMAKTDQQPPRRL